MTAVRLSTVWTGSPAAVSEGSTGRTRGGDRPPSASPRHLSASAGCGNARGEHVAVRARPALARTTSAIVAAVAAIAVATTPATATADGELAVGHIDTYAGGVGWGIATQVPQWPLSIAVDGDTIYTADVRHRVVRALDQTTGEQRVVAGSGLLYQPGTPEGVAATDLRFAAPTAVGIAPDGDLLVAEGNWDAFWFDESRVWRIDRATGTAHTYLGASSGTCNPDKAACPPSAVQLLMPRDFAFDGAGNFFVVDAQKHRVYRMDAATGLVRTVAGSFGVQGSTTGVCFQTCDAPGYGDGGPATLATLSHPKSVAVDHAGTTLLVADTGHGRVRQVDLRTGIITTAAGNDQRTAYVASGPAPAISLSLPAGVRFSPAGGFDVVDEHGVRHVDAITGLATVTYRNDGAALEALAHDSGGDVHVADYAGRQLLRVTGPTSAQRIAGTGKCCGGGDGGPARAAVLYNANDVAIGGDGSLFLAEGGGFTDDHAGIVRRITPGDARIRRFAGTGMRGYTGDGGPAADARLDMPLHVATHSDGAVYVGDRYAIRKVAPSGVVTTVAGTGIPDGDQGEGVVATAARVTPGAVAVDPQGRVVFAEDHGIRRIDHDGRIRTIAGGSGSGFAGDGGDATSARFCGVMALTYDAAGNLLVADRGNHRIRRITTSGTVSTVAGSGPDCTFTDVASAGDGGQASAATFEPWDVEVGVEGVVYVAERHAVRRVGTDGIISTVAGTGGGGENGTDGVSGDRGPATQATIGNVLSIALDEERGRLYVLHHASHIDDVGNRVRVVRLT
jgi:sugar lactone lactonase YvrE